MRMCDQIRDMGMQMVVEESGECPGMRSRLWDRGEIMTMLNNMKVFILSTAITSFVFDSYAQLLMMLFSCHGDDRKQHPSEELY